MSVIIVSVEYKGILSIDRICRNSTVEKERNKVIEERGKPIEEDKTDKGNVRLKFRDKVYYIVKDEEDS